MKFRRLAEAVLFLTLVTFTYPVGIKMNQVLLSTVELSLFLLVLITLLKIKIDVTIISFFKTKIFKVYSLFFLSIVLTSLLNGTIYSQESIVSFIRFIEAYIFFMCIGIILINSKISHSYILKIIKVTAILGSLYTIVTYQFFTLEDNTQKIGSLLGGGYGAITSCGIILFGTDFLRKRKPKILFWLLLCLIGTLFTLTRTWLIAPIFSFLILKLFKTRIKIIGLIKISFAVLTILLVLHTLKINSIGDNFMGINRIYEVAESVLGNREEKTTVDSRVLKWTNAIQQYKTSPIYGVGLENINLGLPSWIDPLGNKRSDSQYIDTLVSNGIIGFIGLLYLVFQMLRTGIREVHKNNGKSEIYFLLTLNWFFASFFWATMYGFNVIFFSILFVLSSYLFSSKSWFISLASNGK